MTDADPAEIVRITSVPNVPFAELVVSDLKANGIEAFYKSAGVGPYGITSLTGPAGPCDIYVQRADAQRALDLLPPQ
jgi:hypothetical protein